MSSSPHQDLQRRQQRYFATYAIDYASHIIGSSLSREDALLSYTMYFFPKVWFPLPALTLTMQQYNKIPSPALTAVLPIMHLNRHAVRSVIFGPLKYGGINLPYIYTFQCLGQLHLFLGHLRMKDKNRHIDSTFCCYLQLIIGSATSLFHLSYTNYAKWILQGWLTSLWQLLSRIIKFIIHEKHQWAPTPQGEYDIMLVDFFVTLKYKPKDLKLLNKCRLYLQAISLMDISSADDRVIIPNYKDIIVCVDKKSKYNWSIQQQPGKSAWKLW
jgi:hypothetical protein